jgi:hypothetical protein
MTAVASLRRCIRGRRGNMGGRIGWWEERKGGGAVFEAIVACCTFKA